MHFRNIGRRIELIALPKRPAKARSKLSRDGALARTRDAHDNQDRRGAVMRARAVQAMDVGRIRNKHRPGPADEQAALDNPEHPSDPFFEAGRISDGLVDRRGTRTPVSITAATAAARNAIVSENGLRFIGAFPCAESARIGPYRR
jgi:hypothetical protein